MIDDLLAREEEADFDEMDGLEVNGLLSTCSWRATAFGAIPVTSTA